jgi:hypothetical protein
MSAGVIGTGGASIGHEAGSDAGAALEASICRLTDPVISSMSRSTTASRLAMRSRSSLRPRTAAASCRAVVSASNWRAAAWPGGAFKAARACAARCAPTSLRPQTTATKSAAAAAHPQAT